MKNKTFIYSIIRIFTYIFVLTLIFYLIDLKDVTSIYKKILFDSKDLFLILLIIIIFQSYICLKYIFGSKDEDVFLRLLISIPVAILIERLLFMNSNNKIIIIMLIVISIVSIVTYILTHTKKRQEPIKECKLSSVVSDNYIQGEYYIIDDKPINCIVEDVIDTNIFVDNLKDYIYKYCKPNKSLIIGLIGEWGSGKSSIINRINEGDEFIYFSSWQHESNEAMIKDLYSLIYNKIRNNSGLVDILRTDICFNNYEIVINNYVRNKVGFDIAKYNDKKQSINNLLKNKKKLIVVIDDIDRLHKNKMNLLFNFIYNIINFSNINFIICYDEDIIKKYYDEKNKNYFDKIVNSKIYIPKINPDSISNVLKKSIDNVLKKHGIIVDDEIKVYELIINYISGSFSNIRDITRFINSLQMDLLFCKSNKLYYIDVIIVSFIKYKYHDDFIYVYNNLPYLVTHGIVSNEHDKKLNNTSKKLLKYLFYLKSFEPINIEKKEEISNKYYKLHRCMFGEFCYDYFTQGESESTILFEKISKYFTDLNSKSDYKKSIIAFYRNNKNNTELFYKYFQLYLDIDNDSHKKIFIELLNIMNKYNDYHYSFIYHFIEKSSDYEFIINNIDDIIVLNNIYINYNFDKNINSDKKYIIYNCIINRIKCIFNTVIDRGINIFDKKNYKNESINIFYTHLKDYYKSYSYIFNNMINRSNIFRVVWECMDKITRYSNHVSYIYVFNKDRAINYSFDINKIDMIMRDYKNAINYKKINDQQLQILKCYFENIKNENEDYKVILDREIDINEL